MNPYRQTIRGRLLLCLLTVFTLIMLAVLAGMLYGPPLVSDHYPGLIQETRSHTFQKLAAIADHSKGFLRQWLRELRADSTVLAEYLADSQELAELRLRLVEHSPAAPELTSPNSASHLDAHLEQIRNRYQEYETIRLIDLATGIILASTIPDERGQISNQHREILDLPATGRETALSIHQHRYKQSFDINMLRLFTLAASRDEASAPVRIAMGIEINSTELLRPLAVNTQNIGMTGEIVLVDSQYRHLSSIHHRDNRSIPLPPIADKILALPARLAASGNEGFIEADDYRGVPVLAAYRHIHIAAGQGLGLIVKFDLEEINAPLRRTVLYVCLIGLVGLAALSLLTMLLASQLLAPLTSLTETARRIEKGDLAARAKITSKNEIGLLAATFNQMLDRLAAWNAELEATVQMRTTDLRAEIEERKRTEQQLAASESDFRTLVENIPGAVFRCELEFPWRVQFISDGIETLSGYRQDEFMTGGVTFGQLIDPEDRDLVETKVREGIETSQPYTVEYRLRAKNGGIRWLHEKGQAVYAESSVPLYLGGVIIDITDRKRAEAEKTNLEGQLRQAQKLEAIGTMAGGIAHDFNNLLAVILGYTDLARLELPTDDKIRDHLDEVRKAGFRARDLVKQILAFSRKAEQEKKPIIIQYVINEALKLLRASTPSTIEIRRDINNACPPVLADPTQVHQVMLNLCANAIQAMEGNNGILEVSLQPVAHASGGNGANGLPDGEYVRLTVRDNGPGIDQSIIDRIFDPYFTTKEVGKGTGLGLAVVHGIVRAHHGAVTVESSPGQGTAFHVLLPASREEAVVVEPPSTEPLPGGSERIMVVDDESGVLMAECYQLRHLGYQVTGYAGSIEAHEVFMQDPQGVDLVITDQTMPGMTGSALAGKMLDIRPDLPIIICTGYSSQIDAAAAEKIGVKAFLMKPVPTRQLADTVRRLLDGKKEN